MSDVEKNDYLTFLLDDVVYAVDVRSVREILPLETVTSVPRTAPYLKGVMNIRGTVISVIDLRVLLNIPVKMDDETSSIIVSEVQIPSESEMVFGFIADDVQSVVGLETIPVTEGYAALDMLHNDFIKEIGKHANSFVLVLDMLKIITHIEEQVNSQTGF